MDEQKEDMPRPEELELKEILNECLDAPGYIVFVGSLSRKRDEKGFNLINFRYRRYNYSFEDTKQAVQEFKKKYEQDILTDG